VIESTASGRVRAFGYFVIAAVYFFLAQMVASRAASGFVSGQSYELVERIFLLFLLVIGYTAMGRVFQRQKRPMEAMGLVFRPGWSRELGLGAALGWGMMIASILPLVLIRGLIVTIWAAPRQFGVLGIDILLLAVAALGEEVVFRGYPFQRLIEVMGPFLATLVISALFGVAHALNPASSHLSIVITIFAGWLLAAAYLRTRALWLSWGWHFAWNASMGLLFGLPVSGITRFSPVIQSNTIGPLWITGGEYGPEASMVTAIVMLIGLIVLFAVTRGYSAKYAHPGTDAPAVPLHPDAAGSVLAPLYTPSAPPEKFRYVELDPGVEPREISPLPGEEPLSDGHPSGQTENLPIPPDGRPTI
jgi:uncharacterized protein